MIEFSENRASTSDFLNGGEMGRRIREFNWSKTSLGPQETWSETLKSVVSLMLTNRFPMLLWWGKDYVQLYNDAYIPVLGMKHPSVGLGNPGYKCWDEIWDVLGPLVDTPFNGGPATWMDDILLKVNRNNRVEETHFTIAYSPVLDPVAPGGIGGVLATVNEITKEIVTRRQMETLGKLGKGVTATQDENEVYRQVASVLAENDSDIPFAFIHQLNERSEEENNVVATTGIREDSPLVSMKLESRATMRVVPIDMIDDIPMGAWDLPPREMVQIPIRGPKEPVAILTIGLNPYRQFDDLYSNFVQLLADQVSFGIGNARAFKQEQEKAEALAEVDRAKTQFFGNVSHEFRTPLTLMLGPVNDMLAKDSSSIVLAERDVLLLVQRNALRLQKLVNSLLDFSRIEAGRYRASFQPVDIGRITSDLASNFQSLMTRAGLKFEVDCNSSTQPVYLDIEMWEKIVLNLISNAFKYTLHGTISVKTREAGDHVHLIVSDTGVGISKVNQSHLFERFHRIENVRSRTYEGTGIGLALVNELVKMHGGEVSVDSTEGEGTTFTVSIPLGFKHLPADMILSGKGGSASSATMSDEFREEASRWLSTDSSEVVIPSTSYMPKVLLAEDNADMQTYIKNILKEFCDVYTVSNGRQAIEIARAIRPDLVLTDIMMPEIDGLGVLKSLRGDETLKSVPVILLSARSGEEARVEGLRSGADDYLTKPFARNELIARVTTNLQLSKLRQEVQQTVRFSESKLRALVTATSDVIYRMSPDWETMFQLDGRNFLKDTGLPLENWQEKYIHPKDRSRVTAAIQEAIKNKSMFQLEHQVIRNDGSLGWTFSRAIPILDETGEIIEWFGAATDISNRKLYEGELEARVEDRTKALNKANSDLQVSNEDLQQFAHVASHDLKEPLRKVKTFALRIKEELDGSLPEKGKVYIDRILGSADRMATMIDGVLTYSSLNGAGFMIEVIDLNVIIANIETDLELVIDQKHAKIEYPKLPSIKGGRVLIHQLFYNLINNSLKFSDPSRPPVIRIKATEERRGGGVINVISVSDNGIGFDQVQSKLIFDTFTRLHSKDRYDGTGLGLALCKKIVERHNGTIRAISRKDEGSTFIMELPVL